MHENFDFVMKINEINIELSGNSQRYINECCESESDGKIDGFGATYCKRRGGGSLPAENILAIYNQTFVILLATVIPKYSKQTEKTIHDQTFPMLLTIMIPNTIKNLSPLAVPPSATRTSL
jgi:hypothetical protein